MSKATVTKPRNLWKEMRTSFIVSGIAMFVFGGSITWQVTQMVQLQTVEFPRIFIISMMLGFSSFTMMRLVEMTQQYGARMENEGYALGIQRYTEIYVKSLETEGKD